HLIGETLHETRAKQRGTDKPVANILGCRQRFFFRRRPIQSFCRYQCAAGCRYEFVFCAEVPGSKFRYRATAPRQAATASGHVTGGAGAFIEMDAKAFFRCLDFLERCQCLFELLWGEKTILILETLWGFLGPSTRDGAHERHREQDKLENL